METALEHILTNSYKADMISYINVHPEVFEELIKLAIPNKKNIPGALHGCCGVAWMKMTNEYKAI